MEKVCFLISPMGEDGSPTRVRADFVLETYVRPACQMTGYRPVRADHGVGQDIVKGVTTALQNAPMAIAYMGATPDCLTDCRGSAYWNANVMIEVGYRLASRLPLIFMCDRDARGAMPDLPLTLKTLNVISLPTPPPNAPPNWSDAKAFAIVQRLVGQIQEAEAEPRFLDSMHGLASIHATNKDTQKPEDLYYSAASEYAVNLFGPTDADTGRPRLVGRSLAEVMSGLKERMHPVQWRKFDYDQKHAVSKLKNRAHDDTAKVSTAAVPIVFVKHDDPDFIDRAYLPIITQDYHSSTNNWYNLRVLYLNVTTVTEKVVENGEEFYVCRLDHTSEKRLEPLKPPVAGIKVFLSYSARNKAAVTRFYDLLGGFTPYVERFIDTEIPPGTDWPKTIAEAVRSSEICFLFLDDDAMGGGQEAELSQLLARTMSTSDQPKCIIVPVLLGKQKQLPSGLVSEWVSYDGLTADALRRIFCTHFRHRCPSDWAQEPVSV